MTNRYGKEIYSGFKLCPNLKIKDKCFRVQRYKEGAFEETFHEHVPSHRLSLESELEVLRALVDQCAGWPPTFILRSRLNRRRGGPSQYPGFRSHVEYPEAGVIRRYFSSGHATAWSDQVIAPASFRRDAAEQRQQRSSS
jgi:hypothetical protein